MSALPNLATNECGVVIENIKRTFMQKVSATTIPNDSSFSIPYHILTREGFAIRAHIWMNNIFKKIQKYIAGLIRGQFSSRGLIRR